MVDKVTREDVLFMIDRSLSFIDLAAFRVNVSAKMVSGGT
jgi:hypothetical protein